MQWIVPAWFAAILLVAVTTNAQQLPSPTFSKTLNSRTTTIKNGWELDFDLQKPAMVVAYLQFTTETDWEDPSLPALVLEVLIDERLASHLVTYMGRQLHPYAVHLGALIAGRHYLTIQRVDSSKATLKLGRVRIDAYDRDHPFYQILAHAPLIFGRLPGAADLSISSSERLQHDMRASDVPLILAYEERTLADGKEIKYTAYFSNESGGTPPPGLLHKWGRYTDIEWAYRVELDTSGKRRQAFYQGRDHQEFIYYGSFENDQPALQVATLNNMFSDSLTTKLRFALPPLFMMPPDGLRENVMLQAPWSWTVSAKEARREQRLNPQPVDSVRINDLRRYLYIQFAAAPETPGVAAGGFFIVKYKNQPNEYASHLWNSRLVIRDDTTMIRQTAVPLPAGTTAEDLERLDFVADLSGGKLVLTNILRLFSLDEHDQPQPWKSSWHGLQKLAPGQRIIFFVDGFHLRRSRYFALPQEWHFMPDSQATGSVPEWAGKPADERQWPTIRIGEPWEHQGYAGYDGMAWYRCQFSLDRSWQGERIWLGIGGVDDRYQLWVNGKLARDFPADSIAADKRFSFTEITSFVQFDKPNRLAVRVEDFGDEGGIVALPVGIGNFPDAFTHAVAWPMADPQIDRETPFDYFQHPVAVLGIKGHPAVTMVTPEGYLYTGFVEMMFLAGSELRPLICRVKTFADENFGVIRYEARADEIEYTFEVITLLATRDSLSPLLNFLRVQIQNPTNRPRQARFALAPRFTGNHHRFPTEIAFNNNWHYRVVGRFLFRDDRVLLSLPQIPFAATFPRRAEAQATTPTGKIEYTLTLAPGESQQLTFCMPQTPMLADSALAYNILTFDFDRLRTKAADYWKDLLGRGTQISLPEPKVNAAVRASLGYHFIAFDHRAGQRVDKLFNNRFEPFHAAHAARLYDLFGYHDLAGEILRDAADQQMVDEIFTLCAKEEKRFGAMLWAWGEHFLLSRDSIFAREIFPAVKKAVEWLHQARQRDAWQIFPSRYKPEESDGGVASLHDSGANFYALLGLRSAIELARAVGTPDDVFFFTREHDTLQVNFLRRLNEAASRSGGYIPTKLERKEGLDAGTLAAVYPTGVLAPWDERITATLTKARGQFQEGLLAQNDAPFSLRKYLCPDLTAAVAETELRRGEQQNVIERFYALLVHTSATHAGVDYPVRPWGERDPDFFLPWEGSTGFATAFATLLRNMLLREEGRELHLFSAVSPAWLQVGQKISVHHAMTRFGPISFIAEVKKDRLVIDFSSSWHMVPLHVVFHFPYFANVQRIVVNGLEAALQEGRANLSPHARRIEIFWQNNAHRERLSYDTAVDDFKREYRERYRLWQADQRRSSENPVIIPSPQSAR
ncbi:MAG: hypothetical protein ONA90_01585 [candidate division KSB1 bacterium]|nr:hypothetical protein [candidate division KSB1 bacterium]